MGKIIDSFIKHSDIVMECMDDPEERREEMLHRKQSNKNRRSPQSCNGKRNKLRKYLQAVKSRGHGLCTFRLARLVSVFQGKPGRKHE